LKVRVAKDGEASEKEKVMYLLWNVLYFKPGR